MKENRNWTHAESPEGTPSAATYRLGCRCSACKAANTAYMKAYRAQQVDQVEYVDGTTVYHSHVGIPSKRTARKHMCMHPRCLDLAGLRMLNGAVVDKKTSIVDTTFGAFIEAKAVA